MLSGGFRAAADLLRRAPEDHAYACIVRAEVALGRGEPDEARRWAERAAARATDDAEGRMHAARAANQQGFAALIRGDVAAARPAYERAIGILRDAAYGRTDLAVAQNGLGECARLAGDLDGAEAAYAAALATWPYELYRLNLAIVQIERGRLEPAREALRHVGARGVPVLVLTAGLARAVCAASAGEAAAFDDALRPFARGWPAYAGEYDVARLASLAGAAAARHRGWTGRAVRARRVALAVYRQLGRARDADAEERALRRLADAGAGAPLGPFTLEHPIARGGFAEVWRARHASGEEVAVKILGARTGRPDALQRELRAVAALDHPNVVRLLDHGRVDRAAAVMSPGLSEGAPWIATELADGTIEPLLGRADWTTTSRVLVALLDALAHAHARGLVHLDVKPANVLLAGDVPRLADFGLASAIGADDGTFAGTPSYMAPELFVGGRVGPWTDLYAVGCLALALASGAPPFGGTTLEAFRDAHLGATPVVAPRVPVPAAFGPWVRRLLAKRVEDRFQRAADAAAALLRLGPAVGDALGAGPALADLPTVVLAPPEPGAPPLAVLDDLAAIPEPVVPLRWDRPRAPPPSLADVGLALFGLRAHPFVGRERQRSLLWAALRDAVGGRVRVVAIEGPPGIGASALAGWLCERAHEVGAADVLVARASAADRPGAALCRAALDGAEAGGLGPLERHVLVARALAAASRRRPIVLCVDDPDRDTLATVARLLRLPGRVLVVLTTRGGVDLDDVVPVPLGPLSAAEQRELLEALLPLAPAALDRLAAVTGGDPRFAVQLVTELVAADRLEPGPDGAGLREGQDLPGSLAALWASRVEGAVLPLGVDARAALRVAALLEPAVDDAVWADACARAAVPFTAEGRDVLIDARLAVGRPGGWAFVDAAVRAPLLGREPAPELRVACAEALEAAGADPLRVADHWLAAERSEPASKARRAAMNDRATAGARAEAHAIGDRLLAVAGSLRPEAAVLERVAVATVRGQMAVQASDPDAAERWFAEARDEALRGQRPDLAAESVVLAAGSRRVADRPATVSPGELERIAEAAVPPRTRYRALLERGFVDRDAGRLEAARAWLERAVEVATPLGPASAGNAKGSLGSLLLLLGDPDGGLRALVEARDLVPGALNRALIGLNVAHALRSLGRLEEAEREYVAVEEAFEAVGNGLSAYARMGRALVHWLAGRRERGDALMDEALAVADPALPGGPGLVTAARLARLADADDAAFAEALGGVIATPADPSIQVDVRAYLAVAMARAAGRPERVERLSSVAGDVPPAGSG